MNRLINQISIIIMIVLFGVSFFTNRSEYPRPTEAFYVNDYAEVLMQATKKTITDEGERLFDMTYDEVDGGSQVVFATFAVENLSDIANYDKTDIYREWKIGKDDMGVLVIFFYMDDITDDFDDLVIVETQIEVGYRMEQYLTPTELNQMVESSIFNEDYNWWDDLAIGNLLYQILEDLYVSVYGYEYFNYDMETFEDYLWNYEPTYYTETSEMSLVSYLLSPYSSNGEKVFTVLPYAFLLLYGFGYTVNKGAGGSSGGMGLFKRKK